MEKKNNQVSQKTRFLALSLKKNRVQNEKMKKVNHSSDVIAIDESFESLRSDFPKSRLRPNKIYSPIVLEDSHETSNVDLLLDDDKHPSKSGNVSLNLSACSTHNKSQPSCNGWSPAQDYFCATPRTKPEPSNPADVLNESQEHCSTAQIQKSHYKLLSELYGDIWKKFREPSGVSKKLLYDDDEEKENIRSVIKKNKELYLTDSEKKIKDEAETAEKRSKKKLYTECVCTPEVPKHKINIPRDVKTTVKKNTKAMTITELVKVMDDVLKDKVDDTISNIKSQNNDTSLKKNKKENLFTNSIDKKIQISGKLHFGIDNERKTKNGHNLTETHTISTNKDDNGNKVKNNIDILTKKLKKMDVCHTPETKRLSFVASLADNVPSWRCNPEALKYHDKYKTLREQLVRQLYNEFNREVFGDRLDKDMPLLWDTKLRSTAGTTTNRLIKKSTGEKRRLSSIKLSSKVLDTPQRVRDTLIHEMCHAATWQVDGELRAGHGPLWNNWCKVALRVYPELEQISRCHELEIHHKYCYKCKQCGYSIKRHSKSIDTTKKCCGYCRGTFEIIVNKKNKDGVVISTPARAGNTNEFALYVKENYGSIKKSGQTHAQVMKLLGEQFSAKKNS